MNFHEFLIVCMNFIQEAFDNKCGVFAPRNKEWSHLCGGYLSGCGFEFHLSNNPAFEEFMKKSPVDMEDFLENHNQSSATTYKQFFLNMYIQIQGNTVEEISLYLYFFHELCDINNIEDLAGRETCSNILTECNFLHTLYRKIRTTEKGDFCDHKVLREIYYRRRDSHPIDRNSWLLAILEKS